ncbi:MAG: DUF7948 domain-containing protein [Anaerolineae bacterium]
MQSYALAHRGSVGRVQTWLPLLLILALAFAGVSSLPLASPRADAALDLAATMLRLPVAFVPVVAGDAGSDGVLYQAREGGNRLAFSADAVALQLAADAQGGRDSVRLLFVGANPNAILTTAEELPGKVNLLLGNDPAQYVTNLPTYSRLVYHHLYPGIDLSYTGSAGQLKGTYVVSPGASPGSIRGRYDGASGLTLNPTTGDLHIAMASGRSLVEQAPVVWQIVQGQRAPVQCRYALEGDGSVALRLGSYDRSLPLTIDPVLVYSAYLGGADFDAATSIAVDASGAAYLTGITLSADFPREGSTDGLSGQYDAFVTKIAPSGDAVVYSTYLGGSGNDQGAAIAVDGNGNAYVVGTTGSSDFPATGGYDNSRDGFDDAFLAKLTPGGDGVLYGTYLGGGSTDQARGVAFVGDGIVYVAGTTFSADFPTLSAYQDSLHGPADSFVAKVNTMLTGGASRLYATYLGGAGMDSGMAVAADSAGNAYVTGVTVSADFPTKNALRSYAGRSDAFVAELTVGGTGLVFSTYLGGAGNDTAYAIDTDGMGRVYVVGNTESDDFPTNGALQTARKGGSDAFVSRISAGGTELSYSTYFGGTGGDYAYGVAVDAADGVHIVGSSASADLPALDALQGYGGGGDAFIATLSSTAQLVYSTHLGSSDSDQGTAIAAGSNGTVYVCGQTDGTDFPRAGALPYAYAGQTDAFVARIDGGPSPAPAPSPTPGPELSGSYKAPSRLTVATGGTVTYTIHLYNSGTANASVAVTDVISTALAYVPSSASHGATYDDATRRLSWAAVTVAAGTEESLEYQATAVAAAPRVVVNTAAITVGDDTFHRSAAVVVVAQVGITDVVLPAVQGLTIGSGDVLTDPSVMLHIAAGDDTGVARMYLKEWQLATSPLPHWEIVQSSGWVPYQADYPWTLGSAVGTHFVGAWVVDDAGNLSLLGRRSMDFASLSTPGATVQQMGVVPYLAFYEAGTAVTATLTPSVGDADLYVWYAGNFLLYDEKSAADGTAVDSVSFTTPRAGTYLFVVFGYTDATYDLSITPAGGPAVTAVAAVQAGPAEGVSSQQLPKTVGLLTEAVLVLSGLDPLSDPPLVVAPQTRLTTYLPVVLH